MDKSNTTKHEITIQARYLVELDNLDEETRKAISDGYELPVLPSFIPSDNIEYLDGFIKYDEPSEIEVEDEDE